MEFDTQVARAVAVSPGIVVRKSGAVVDRGR